MKGTYWIGGLNIEIESIFMEIHRKFSLFHTMSRPDVSLVLTQEDIECERKRRSNRWVNKDFPDPYGSDESIEVLAAHRKICECIPYYNTFLIHGSAIAADEKGYIFTAKSGTGKSTHTRLWRELLGERAIMVDDDKPMIHVNEDGSASVNGTPWNGKHHLGGPVSVPLKAICLLEQSKDNWIREISQSEAMPRLMQQIYRPFKPETLVRTMDCVTRMRISYYQMGCNMDISAAKMSYNAMK